MKKIIKISVGLLLTTAAFFLLSFVKTEQKEKLIWNFVVEVEGDENNNFINSKMIKNQISDMGLQIIGSSLAKIDLERIQRNILQNPSVRGSEVYKTLDGQLFITVQQRTPIARIFNSDGTSFYLDSDGQSMPLSEHYTARVIVVNGAISEKSGRSVSEIEKNVEWKKESMLDDVYHLVTYINQNTTLKSLIDCITISDDKEIKMIPRIGNQAILLGSIDDLDIKFKKLLAFYDQIIQVEQLDKYRVINLKFREQIVCVK